MTILKGTGEMEAVQTTTLTWAEIDTASTELAARHTTNPALRGVYGVPRGGCAVAALVARTLGLPVVDSPTGHPPGSVLIVDDLVDSGATAARFHDQPFDALFRKPHAPTGVATRSIVLEGWLVFPWEIDDEPDGPTLAVTRLIEYAGEDPNRPGLVDTPGRVLRAFTEFTAGYHLDPGEVLARVFPCPTMAEMVTVTGVPFSSLCEHHLLPFTGTVTIGYIPSGQVVGLSKLPRLVEVFARRFQLQEQLTGQIADAIAEHLTPVGVGVLVSAHHSCMSIRGVQKQGAMATQAYRGEVSPEQRSQLWDLHQR